MSDLPEFQKKSRSKIMPLMTTLFGTNFVSLQPFEDHHFRVIFRRNVFSMAEGQTEPSASQWSTLKKRMKRHDHRLFLFRSHGAADCPDASQNNCYYLEFGFFLNP